MPSMVILMQFTLLHESNARHEAWPLLTLGRFDTARTCRSKRVRSYFISAYICSRHFNSAMKKLLLILLMPS